MKGTLHKTEKGWEVWYSKLRTDNQNGYYLDRLPLHPDDATGLFMKDTDARYEGMEMGFEITKDCPFHFTSRCTMDRCDCDVYAKLIDDDLSDWDVTLTDGLEEVEWDNKQVQSPKDKAGELFVTYYQRFPDSIYSNEGAKAEAKYCALVVVDEIIKECYNWNGSDNVQWETNRFDYWNEIKQEIEKL
jgi:hypothetical protein